jgi:hypothetical protein
VLGGVPYGKWESSWSDRGMIGASSDVRVRGEVAEKN